MNKRSVGAAGEARAAAWLEEQGYEILERNFRCRQGEIDLISKKDGCICFVEVKYRGSAKYGIPAEAVDRRKQERISNAASWYLYSHHYPVDQPCRFDVAQVSAGGIELLENAFLYAGRYR